MISHYLEVYKKYISTRVSEVTSFRTSFILIILMDVFFYISALATVGFIYDHITTIGPWDKSQLLFFISFMLTLDSLHMLLVSESFWILSQDIRTGAMDYILLKPVNSLFIVFFRYFRPSSLVNMLITVPTLIYFGLQVELSPLSWFLLPFLLILSFTLKAIIEFTVASSMFWLTEGLGINFLRMQFQALARWPEFIYGRMTKKFFTLLFPILLIGSAPVQFLFDHSQWALMVLLIIAILISSQVLRFIWHKGLLRYDSASS